MGVLEARKDAEKVGFPVVGEEIKDPSFVIDYNIREEQTKDTFNIDNANNQTTTGLATVIPGINAPKLIASTSILGIGANEGDLTYMVGVDNVSSNYTEVEMQPRIGTITVSEIGGDGIEMTSTTIKFLKDGVFYFDIRQVVERTSVASGYYVRTIIYKNGAQFATGRVPYGPTGYVWTGPIQIAKGDRIFIGGCIWSESAGYAPGGTGPSRNISVTEMR